MVPQLLASRLAQESMLHKAEEDALLCSICPADPVTSLVLHAHPPKWGHQYMDISSLHFKKPSLENRKSQPGKLTCDLCF